MKIKFKITKKEKHVFSIIFAFILIISNAIVAYFSIDEIEKHVPLYLCIIIGVWMWYAWVFSSCAIYNHFSKKYGNNT